MKDNKKNYILIIVQIGQHLQNETRKLQTTTKKLLLKEEKEKKNKQTKEVMYICNT